MKYLVLLFALIIFFSCANQTAPTGGPKDEDPPVLLKSIPENRAINYTSNSIELEFDEYLKLNNAKEQIIISPRIDQTYEVKLRKNKVVIEFEESLAPGTTYTINFREAIQDITEGNSPENLKLAFSTGSYLDSLAISGYISELLTDKPAKDVSIFLYDVNDTLTVQTGAPLYFTKTNDKGFYNFENIKNGEYLVYALKDKNKNLQLDIRNEPYAFLSETLLVDSLITDISLSIYQLNADTLKLLNHRQNGTVYEIKYNKFIESFTINNLEDTTELIADFNPEDHHSVRIFNDSSFQDSLAIAVTVFDSLSNQRTDSMFIKFEETAREPTDFKSSLKLEPIFPTDGQLSGNITFNKPVISYTTDSMYIYLDSLTILPLTPSKDLIFNQASNSISIQYTLQPKYFEPKDATQPPTPLVNDSLPTPKPDQKPHIYFGRGAFISPEQDSSTVLRQNLSFSSVDKVGIILIEATTNYENFEIQLLDKQFELVQTKLNEKEFNFNKVKPGEYIIRVLIDSNQNGKWDPGDIKTNTQPEPIYFYEDEDNNKPLTIRANWELGPIQLNF